MNAARHVSACLEPPPSPSAQPRLLYSAEQAACALSCSVHAIRKYLQLGIIQSMKLGSLRRIDAAEVLRLSREGFVPVSRPLAASL
jgi:hypothetical protein